MPKSFGEEFAQHIFNTVPIYIDGPYDDTIVRANVRDLLRNFPLHQRSSFERNRLYHLMMAAVRLLDAASRYEMIVITDIVAQLILSENNQPAILSLNFAFTDKIHPTVMHNLLQYSKISKFIIQVVQISRFNGPYLSKLVASILYNPYIEEVECKHTNIFANICQIIQENRLSRRDFIVQGCSLKRVRKPVHQVSIPNYKSADTGSKTGSNSDDDHDDHHDLHDDLLQIFDKQDTTRESLPFLVQNVLSDSVYRHSPSEIQRIVGLCTSLHEIRKDIPDTLINSIISCENVDASKPVVSLYLSELIYIDPKLKSHLLEVLKNSKASSLHIYEQKDQEELEELEEQPEQKFSPDLVIFLLIQLLEESSLSSFKIIDTTSFTIPQRYFTLLAYAIKRNKKLVDISPLPDQEDIKTLLIRNQLIQAIEDGDHAELKMILDNIAKQHAILLALVVFVQENKSRTTLNLLLRHLKPEKDLLANLENTERHILINNVLCVRKIVSLLEPQEVEHLSLPTLTAYFELTRYAQKVHLAAIDSVNHHDFALRLLQDYTLTVPDLAHKLAVRCNNTRQKCAELSHIAHLFKQCLQSDPNAQPRDNPIESNEDVGYLSCDDNSLSNFGI